MTARIKVTPPKSSAIFTFSFTEGISRNTAAVTAAVKTKYRARGRHAPVGVIFPGQYGRGVRQRQRHSRASSVRIPGFILAHPPPRRKPGRRTILPVSPAARRYLRPPAPTVIPAKAGNPPPIVGGGAPTAGAPLG